MGKGGDGDSVLENPNFRPFRTDDFDVATFTSRALAGSQTTAQAQSEQLREGVRILDAELAQEVSSKHGDLLKNVRRMLDAERSLGDVLLSVESLQSAIRRIRAEITGPYDHIKVRTRQLKNLHATVELLRHLNHRIKLMKKLRDQMGAAATALDLPKAAKLISDINTLDREIDLSGMDVATRDEDFMRSTKQTVHEQAELMLQEGMESMSQAKVGGALQVYFNLQELSQAVQSLITSHLQRLEKLAKAALDARQLNAAAAAGTTTSSSNRAGAVGTTGTWQDKLWSGLKELADAISVSTTAIWHLQRVVAKKKDPLTHVCFLDELVPPDKPLLTQQFWSSLVKMLSEVFAGLAKPVSKSGFMRDALVAGYPRLALIFETMFERLSVETSIKGVTPAVSPEQLQQLISATGAIQSAYLAVSLSRMSDAVTAAFPGGIRALSPPADIQRCISVLHEELKSGSSSPQMAILTAQVAGKALEMLCEKAEFMAAAGPEVRAVAPGTPASTPQLRNMQLALQLQDVHRSLSGLLARLPASAAQELSNSLDTLQATALEVVGPIFKSVMETIEDHLLKVHGLDFSAETSECMMSTSACIAEVATLLAHFRSEYLSKFMLSANTSSCVGSLVERMAARTLIFYVRHASLVRPLGQAGRLQLAKDLADLQLAVGSSLLPLEQLGQPYRVIKTFRSLLFAEPAAILASSMLQDLPPSVVAHHLLSRLPATIQAPHERSGLTPAQYSLWLDTHTTDEVLKGIKAAIQTALPSTQLEGNAQEVLQIILHICKQAGE